MNERPPENQPNFEEDPHPGHSATANDEVLKALLEDEPRHFGSAAKILGVLATVSILGAAAIMFGGKRLMSSIAGRETFTRDPGKIQSWMSAAGFPPLTLPAGLAYAGAYRGALDDKNLRLFVAGAPDQAAGVEKDVATVMDLSALNGPRYFLAAHEGAEPSPDPDFKNVSLQIERQGATTVVENRLWIFGKSTPVLIAETSKNNHPYQLFFARLNPTAAALGVKPKDPNDATPFQPMIAALFHVPSSAVAYAEPEPPAMKMARVIVEGRSTDRKQATRNLAALPGPQPDAAAYLAEALPTSPTEMKIDIVSALQALARKTPAAVTPLIGALKDKSVRLPAMASLGALGPLAHAAISDLKKISANKKGSMAVRKAAAKALAQIQGRPAAAPKAKKKHPAARKKKRR